MSTLILTLCHCGRASEATLCRKSEFCNQIGQMLYSMTANDSCSSFAFRPRTWNSVVDWSCRIMGARQTEERGRAKRGEWKMCRDFRDYSTYYYP